MSLIDAALLGLAAAAPTIILFAGFDAFRKDWKNKGEER